MSSILTRLAFLFFICAFFLSTGFSVAADAVRLDEVVVTGTREASPASQSPVTVNSLKAKDIRSIKPAHPSEAMNRFPGVWVNSTGGEGHVTAIRQPLTTNPVYLFLEDGVPVRSTGFFNHNALYEVNVPGAERIEVIKGTGTALYGSDAIGGTVNVMTRPAPLRPEIEFNPEAGSFGWWRTLLSAGNTWGENGLRGDVNVTHSDGWRERKKYDRRSFTLRWDRVAETSSLKTVVSYSKIDETTSGGAPLTKRDYDDRPGYNYQTFDYRNVDALRVSAAYEREHGADTLLSLIPYARKNEMKLLPEWGIFKLGAGYRGYESTTRFSSAGLLAKVRQDVAAIKGRVIFGLDFDYSPGEYEEKRIIVDRDASSLKYTGFSYDSNTANNYDYSVTFKETTPYGQIETFPADGLKLTLGGRYDVLSYDYENNLSASSNRPASTDKSYTHFSPKAGLTYQLSEKASAYASYNRGFRAPSTGDIFRAGGTAATAVDLKPVKVDSLEAGLRAKALGMFMLDAAVYSMVKKDDIVTYKPKTGDSQRTNAGKTRHRGFEAGVGFDPVPELGLAVSYSYAKHSYSEWRVSSVTDYSGKEISVAPRQLLNARANARPAFLNGGEAELEWVHIGSYWMDDENTAKYDGHDLVNARVSYKLKKNLELYARGMNLFDKRHAERASKSGTDEALYAPGNPQSFYAGLSYMWDGGEGRL